MLKLRANSHYPATLGSSIILEIVLKLKAPICATLSITATAISTSFTLYTVYCSTTLSIKTKNERLSVCLTFIVEYLHFVYCAVQRT